MHARGRLCDNASRMPRGTLARQEERGPGRDTSCAAAAGGDGPSCVDAWRSGPVREWECVGWCSTQLQWAAMQRCGLPCAEGAAEASGHEWSSACTFLRRTRGPATSLSPSSATSARARLPKSLPMGTPGWDERTNRFAPSEGKIGHQHTSYQLFLFYHHLFLLPPDLIPPVARCGRHAAPWFSPHVANRVPPREACPRSRLPSTNPPHTHTTPHYSPHLTPHCSRLYVATFLVQCTRVPFWVNVGFNKLTSGQ